MLLLPSPSPVVPQALPLPRSRTSHRLISPQPMSLAGEMPNNERLLFGQMRLWERLNQTEYFVLFARSGYSSGKTVRIVHTRGCSIAENVWPGSESSPFSPCPSFSLTRADLFLVCSSSICCRSVAIFFVLAKDVHKKPLKQPRREPREVNPLCLTASPTMTTPLPRTSLTPMTVLPMDPMPPGWRRNVN